MRWFKLNINNNWTRRWFQHTSALIARSLLVVYVLECVCVCTYFSAELSQMAHLLLSLLPLELLRGTALAFSSLVPSAVDAFEHFAANQSQSLNASGVDSATATLQSSSSTDSGSGQCAAADACDNLQLTAAFRALYDKQV